MELGEALRSLKTRQIFLSDVYFLVFSEVCEVFETNTLLEGRSTVTVPNLTLCGLSRGHVHRPRELTS